MWDRQTYSKQETKENQRDKKGKMLLLFKKVGKGRVLDKGRKVITEVVKNSYKGSFHRSVFFIFLITSSQSVSLNLQV